MSRMKIAHKLPLTMVGLVFISVLITGSLAINKARKDAIQASEKNLSSIVVSRKEALKSYLNGINQDLSSLAYSDHIRQAALDFIKAWRELGDFKTEELQKSYITDNPHPIGSKEKLDYAKDGTTYSLQHKKYHKWFRYFLRQHGYYDIFLFDPQGNLVYSVFKEQDYATNINTGMWHDTGLGKAFRAAKTSSKAGEQFFQDFKPYAPSYGAPASFISEPILNDDATLAAVLVFQMPISRLNQVMQVTAGLGKTGETYLVGQDGFMRTDSIFSRKSTILKNKIPESIMKKIFAGEKGIIEATNHKGINVIMAYSPLNYHGIKWGVIAEITKDEILAPIKNMQWHIYICMIMVTLISGIISFIMSRGISKPINSITGSMKKLSEGSIDFVIPPKKGDEIGDMGEALEVFRGNRISNHHYEGQIEAINKSLAVIEFDMQGNIIDANANFLYLVGYELDEIKGQHQSMLLQQGFSKSAQYEYLWEKLNQGEYDSGEYMYIGKGAKVIYLQASYNPILGLNNKPFKVIKYCSGVIKEYHRQQ